jgi:flagellin
MALSDGQRAYISNEMVELGEEITAIAGRTQFNGNALLGTDAVTLTFQTGIADTDEQEVDFVDILTNGEYSNLQALLDSAVIGAFDQASEFADITPTIESAINEIAALRAEFGSKVNRINSNLSNLDALSENLSAARSRVIDTDYAAETAMLTRTQILQQAATAMLSQANAQPNVILALLK